MMMQKIVSQQALVREKALDRSYSREHYRESFARFRSRSFETDTSVLLARFKRREYIRIMLRDVLGIELPEEVLPLSNIPAIVPPYLLQPNQVLAMEA